MPELPDVTLYAEAIRDRVCGRVLASASIRSPFLLRTFDPPVEEAQGRRVMSVERVHKRIAIGLEGDVFLVIHLMIAGRFVWRDGEFAGGRPAPAELARFMFEPGTLALIESSKQKRAAMHVVRGRVGVERLRPPGLEPLEASAQRFAERLRSENRTLKRALTDPRLMAGIGNAYSDEILHAAGLSPLALTRSLGDAQLERLHGAMQAVLTTWTERLRADFAGGFPTPREITAFRPDFAVHGRYERPCPACGTSVQRIVYAQNECNYCPRCQTGGKILADRSLSRLLKDDWPRTIEELEERDANDGPATSAAQD